jgi:hypothetical protein
MAHKVICPQKKIISRIFKISGTLAVKMQLLQWDKAYLIAVQFSPVDLDKK